MYKTKTGHGLRELGGRDGMKGCAGMETRFC
jgi:hypothetical protein